MANLGVRALKDKIDEKKKLIENQKPSQINPKVSGLFTGLKNSMTAHNLQHTISGTTTKSATHSLGLNNSNKSPQYLSDSTLIKLEEVYRFNKLNPYSGSHNLATAKGPIQKKINKDTPSKYETQNTTRMTSIKSPVDVRKSYNLALRRFKSLQNGG